MGKANDQFVSYLNNPSNLADLYNGALYGGKKVITPDQLAEHQQVYNEVLPDRITGKVQIRRERDVIKMLCRKEGKVIIATELQDHIHYCMPLRMFQYDAAELHRQLRFLQKSHRQNKDLLTEEEYLSGIKQEDRLIPVVTVLLYHGEGKWTFPLKLTDMLDSRGMDDTLQKLQANYQINVINLTDLNENLFKTGLRELIGMIKRKNDKEKMWSYCHKNEDRFRQMNDATYDLICTMLHMDILHINKEKNRNTKGGKLNMCKAFDDMIKDSEKRGEKRGQKQGEQRLGSLITKLLKDNRTEDALAASKSVRERNRLYAEYGI